MGEYYQGEDNSAELITVTISLAVIATVLAVWRIAYRIWKGVIGLSDYLLVVGMCLALCQAGLNLGAYMRWGYGHHKSDVPPEVLSSTTPKLIFWVNQIFFKASTGTIKLSICAIYMSIFRKPAMPIVRVAQISNYVLIAVVFCYYIGGTLVSTFQCDPIRKAWLPDVPGRCINNDQFRLANGYINCITSIWLIILPFPVLLMMKRRSRELLEFLGLVALGFVHTGCAIWRVAIMYIPNPEAAKDPYWNNTSPNTIAMTELLVGLIAATIIVMRQCFYTLGKGVKDTVVTLTDPPRTAGASGIGSKLRSRTLMTTAASQSRKSYGHSDRSRGIAVTTEIEMESQNRSTEDLFVPPGSGSVSVYHDAAR